MSFLDWLFPSRKRKREEEEALTCAAAKIPREKLLRAQAKMQQRSTVFETNRTHQQVQVVGSGSVGIQARGSVALKVTRLAPRRDYAEEARIRTRREEEEDSRRRFNESANDDPAPMSFYGLNTSSPSPPPAPRRHRPIAHLAGPAAIAAGQATRLATTADPAAQAMAVHRAVAATEVHSAS